MKDAREPVSFRAFSILTEPCDIKVVNVCRMALFAGATRLANQDRLEPSAEIALIEQCRRQNFEAFGKIVDAYQSRILGFVRRMVSSSEEAEDITQEVFVRAYQGMARFDGRASLRTWLFRIAHNLCVDAARKRGRTHQEVSLSDGPDEDGYDVPDSRWNPETITLDAELVQVVEAAVAGMSEKLRTILLLHDREELGYEELSQMLNIPIGTVKSRLFLARNQILKAIQEYQS